ncbi:MAG TPA: amidase, partial [Candidatus Bathyarchaeia archaeon]|nr:amidase [Candidatus Bathyarchaeia archaeon]
MRRCVRSLSAIAFLAWAAVFMSAGGDTLQIKKDDIVGAQHLIALPFTQIERDSMRQDLIDNLQGYLKLRGVAIANSVPPAILFNPIPVGLKLETKERGFAVSKARKLEVPANLEELAFWPVRDLAELIRTKKITSTQLTKMYIERLKKYGPTLHCVITLTEERALEHARRADEEIAKGKYRGLLHG